MSDTPYPAPEVNLPRDGGEMLNLADFRPNGVVLFFYPKANTPGCTKESIGFSKAQTEFQALGYDIVGISKDPVKAQDKFVEKKSLTVPLLSDEDFGVWKEKSMYGKTYMGIERSTFLINGEGQVVREWRKVKVPGHVEAVLEAIKEL